VLPVHAAGVFSAGEPESLSDYVVSSYIPTLSALGKARKDWEPSARTAISGLIVSESSPGRGYSRLPMVVWEMQTVRDCFTKAGALIVGDAEETPSVATVLSTLETTNVNILHMACHGVQRSSPLDSCFVLRDGDLKIQDLMGLNLRHAFLAFLSACQTAQGDEKQPDQAVHLAASMLFCGFRSVIATMWYVLLTSICHLFRLTRPRFVNTPGR
jgi:CHAT domain-containing protein